MHFVDDFDKLLRPFLSKYTKHHLPVKVPWDVYVKGDDARTTLELPDRYVVEPAQVFWSRSTFLDRAARPVSEEFRYASGTNDHWLGVEELREILADGQV